MRLQCQSCLKSISFEGEQPRFCSFCGRVLSTAKIEQTEVESPKPDLNLDDIAQAMTIVPQAREFDQKAQQPKQVGGYQLLRRLGCGGMGSVYEAEDIASGQKVALKLINPGTELLDCRAVQRFRQEGQLASSLSHPRCVFVLAADEEKGQPYIVMELMPGRTLADLVREKGPLPYREAVKLILDVIDGLMEAHRLGLVHRDVKPSNCFLDAEGRVKIGDFGLAKLLDRHMGDDTLSEVHLTGTGTFIGTPLYAAPEQIKGERIDQQVDVYSVTATLYFLITGHAPFEEQKHATALLARIVCEDPEPITTYQPDLPQALERVISRGMERDRKRRYGDLEALRQALVVFQPRRRGIVRLGMRIMAFLADIFLALLLIVLAKMAVAGLSMNFPNHPWLRRLDELATDSLWFEVLLSLTAQSLIFVLPEILFGCSFGKWCFRLRLYDPEQSQRPHARQVLLRFLIFVVAVESMNWIGLAAMGKTSQTLWSMGEVAGQEATGEKRVINLTSRLEVMSICLGSLVLATTMRSRNGYRGLHERLSGTATVRIAQAAPRSKLELGAHASLIPTGASPLEAPVSLGSFTLTHLVWKSDVQALFAGTDARLGRTVWVWQRPSSWPELTDARRGVSRVGRLRWLAGGEQNGVGWDAFLATPGVALPQACKLEAMDWTCTFHLLRELAEELAAAEKDQTLPGALCLEQVWLQPRGQAKLLDVGASPSKDETTPSSTENLHFLGRVAATALRGAPRVSLDTRPLQKAIPIGAYELLNRLLGYGKPLEDLAQFQHELAQLEERPFRLTRWWRFRSMLIQGAITLSAWGLIIALLAPIGLLWGDQGDSPQEPPRAVRSLVRYSNYFTLAFLLLWTAYFRGRTTFGLVGLAIRRKDGAVLEPWRACWRMLVIGLPVAVMFTFAQSVKWHISGFGLRFYIEDILFVLSLIAWALTVIWQPACAWHDRLAGTVIVPK